MYIYVCVCVSVKKTPGGAIFQLSARPMASESIELTRQKHNPFSLVGRSKRRKHHHISSSRHRNRKEKGETSRKSHVELQVGKFKRIEVEERTLGDVGGGVRDEVVPIAGLDCDMEEGEIVEDYCLADNVDGKKIMMSDFQSGEIDRKRIGTSDMEVLVKDGNVYGKEIVDALTERHAHKHHKDKNLILEEQSVERRSLTESFSKKRKDSDSGRSRSRSISVEDPHYEEMKQRSEFDDDRNCRHSSRYEYDARDKEKEHSSSRETLQRHRDRTREKKRDSDSDRLSTQQTSDNRDCDSSHRTNSGDHHREKSRRRNGSCESNPEERDWKLLKREGDTDRQEEYQGKILHQLAQLEEDDDLAKIKEESRRRTQAILEKYKNRHSQQHNEAQPRLVVEEQARPSSEPVESTETTFSVGRSPLQNGVSEIGEGVPKSERLVDMFCDDLFEESPTGVCKGESVAIEKNELGDNWDDGEGYYGYRFGEVLDGRYEIIAAHGEGVFSNVVRAKDLKAEVGDPDKEVAIKIIRNNEATYKAGMQESVILKKLLGADPEDKCHCVRLISIFRYRNHLCLVFESLYMNLRQVLKKFGRDIGLKLTAVRAYAKQIFIALKHLKNCGVLHCDVKPDNMLVNEAKNVLKLCDFGIAMLAGENAISPYFASRFYRAPEVILGLPYSHPSDMWSVGCCLFELYAGKVLFPGSTNNDMLRLHMELKGPFSKKMLRRGGFVDHHFDRDLNFLATEQDPVTKKVTRRLLVNTQPKDLDTMIVGSPGEDPKMVASFRDLMERILILDPDKRLTVSQALSHPFITGK